MDAILHLPFVCTTPFSYSYCLNPEMSSNTETTTQTAVTKKVKKLKPARKQVKPGDVEKKEAPQTGKEYSEYPF